jgi:hypothetical protein
MIKVENTKVHGLDVAVKAMRHPMESYNKSDSYYDPERGFVIGKNDLDLMQRLYKSGTEHSTYARQIQMWVDITAPLYWWKEMDRYCVGKSQVSTSTMHKIHAKEFTLDDFSHEHLSEYLLTHVKRTIDKLNESRELYLDTKDKDFWWEMIQILPSSYNQKRTINMSYEVVFKIIRERKNHKLDEWREFVEILEKLPYVKEIMNGTESKEA